MFFDYTEEGAEPVLKGDVHFVFKHKGVLTDSLICRVAFNTAFVPPSNSLVFTKETLSPDSLKKESKIPDNFIIQFVFADYCSECKSPWNMRLD